ncbi:MAG TPA: hypothetical protein VIG24_09580 [Acidimicrobiia bacterium]
MTAKEVTAMATDEFDAENIPTFPRPKIELALDELEQTDPVRHARLLEVLGDPQYSSAAIARVVTRWGFPMSPDAVQKWRKARG